jgi:hypothetical protein
LGQLIPALAGVPFPKYIAMPEQLGAVELELCAIIATPLV